MAKDGRGEVEVGVTGGDGELGRTASDLVPRLKQQFVVNGQSLRSELYMMTEQLALRVNSCNASKPMPDS